MNLKEIRQALSAYADSKRAITTARFFKTAPGEYGQGDRFIGVSAPDMRKVALVCADATDEQVLSLLASPIHEERALGLAIWVAQSARALKSRDKARVAQIAELYLAHTDGINNWDLVDLSCYKILGPYIELKGKSDTPSSAPRHVKRAIKDDVIYSGENSEDFVEVDETPKRVTIDPATLQTGSYLPLNLWRGFSKLRDWARQGTLWQKRIAMITTFHFIRLSEFEPALEMAQILISEKEDLLQKAVGWMLREVGKRDREVEEAFLKRYYRGMGRTALRYAIEKFEPAHRQRYLSGKV
jgi:3-methyladenine DNA glycosylase AlkD